MAHQTGSELLHLYLWLGKLEGDPSVEEWSIEFSNIESPIIRITAADTPDELVTRVTGNDRWDNEVVEMFSDEDAGGKTKTIISLDGEFADSVGSFIREAVLDYVDEDGLPFKEPK